MLGRPKRGRRTSTTPSARREFEQVEEQFQQDLLLARKDEILEALFSPAKEEDPSVMLQYAAATEDTLRSVLRAAAVSENERVLQQVILACEARDLGDLFETLAPDPPTADRILTR